MKKPFLSACIFYLLSAAIIFPYVRWYADNPDTFQYIAIAQKYLSGDWTHAVNGYWSPLISVLLIIPILIFENDLLAFKILQLLTGIFTLCQWSNLLNKIPLRNNLRIILLFISIPFFLDYALLNCTPDLLFMGLLFLLLNLILSGNISEDKNLAIKTGITGGLLYLTKAFAFPFFIAFTIFIILFEIYRKTNHKPNWKNISKLYGVFFLISFFWIIILSSRYNKFTISEAAVFNSSREVAPLPGRSSELPILNKGLYAPPVNSFSAWESPGDYVNDERVTFFNSTSDYLKIIKEIY